MKSTNILDFVFAYEDGGHKFFRAVANTDIEIAEVFKNFEGGIVKEGVFISDNVWIDKDSKILNDARIDSINLSNFITIKNSTIEMGTILGDSYVENSTISGNFTITHTIVHDSEIGSSNISASKSFINDSKLYGTLHVTTSRLTNVYSYFTDSYISNFCSLTNVNLGHDTRIADNVILKNVNIIGTTVTFISGFAYQGDDRLNKTTIRFNDATFAHTGSVFELQYFPDFYGQTAFFYDSLENKIHVVYDFQICTTLERYRRGDGLRYKPNKKMRRYAVKIAKIKFKYGKEKRRRFFESIKKFFRL